MHTHKSWPLLRDTPPTRSIAVTRRRPVRLYIGARQSMALVSQMTAKERESLTNSQMLGMLNSLVGERYIVKGNGTCWLYAVMGALGVLEHGKKSMLAEKDTKESSPTARDEARSKWLLAEMRTFCEIDVPQPEGGQPGFAKEREQLCESLKSLKVWHRGMGARHATKGGAELFWLLSCMAEAGVVVLDKTTLGKAARKPRAPYKNTPAEQKHASYWGGTAKMAPRTLTLMSTVKMLQTTTHPLLVIEFDSTAEHFAYYKHTAVAPERFQLGQKIVQSA